MAIATSPTLLRDVPYPLCEIVCSTIDAGLDVNIAHTGPSGVAPSIVDFTVTTGPTDGTSDVKFEWDKANDSTANNTIRAKFSTNVGGSLTGAVVSLFLHFGSVASGGIS